MAYDPGANAERLVCLEGTPAKVGRAFGKVNAQDIAAQMKQFYENVERAEGISTSDLVRAGKHYLRLVRQYAPHWITEAEALAQAAGIDAELYIVYQGAKYRGINRPECFSYYSSPLDNLGRVTLLHKNRDNVARPQCAYAKGVRVRGKRIYRFMANGDTSDMGIMMALNEAGLAIVADVGAPEPHPRQLGMMNTDIMRLIVEQAGDVEEALALLTEIHNHRVYAGGKVSTNWLMADRRGRGLRVYQFHETLVLKRKDKGFLVMRDQDDRGTLVKKELSRHRGRITSGIMNRIARRRPVLAATNISSFTAVIPSRHTEIFSYAYFALNNAGKTLYVPLYIGVTATPRSMVDGTFFRLSNAHPFGENLFATLKERGVALEEFEEQLERDRSDMECTARHALAQRGVPAARCILTQGCLRLAQRVQTMLHVLASNPT